MKISISIITPTIFGDILPKVVDSLHNGTSLPFEHIIICDIPTIDNFMYLVSRFREKNNIRLVFNPFLVGAAGAFNIGLKLARGDYIGIVSDDLILPRNWIDISVGTLLRHPEYGWVSCWDNGHKFHTNCSMLSRECLNKVGYLDEQFNPCAWEFNDYYLRVIKEGYVPHIIDKLRIHKVDWSSWSIERIHPNWRSNIDIENYNKLIRKWNYKGEARDPVNWDSIPVYNEDISIPEGVEIVEVQRY